MATPPSGGSVARLSAGLVIERLQNLGSTPDAVARRCVLGKTLNVVSHLGVKQSTRCVGPAWQKTCKQNSSCVGVVCQTQNIAQHLVQKETF